MKLKYYGTAAAEGVPALYCECDVCKNSKKMGGKNVRTRSQALVNDALLIDVPPDTLYHAQFLNLPLENIENVLITHAHSDHLHPPTLVVRAKGYVTHDIEPINIYGSMPSIDLIFNELRKSGVNNDKRWNLFEVFPYEEKKFDIFSVTALKANHAFSLYPLNYEIFDGKSRLLYAHDTGVFLDETWEYFNRTKPYFDLVSLDCTMGISSSSGHHHMNLDDCIKTKSKMIESDFADEKTVFILNHFSHNGKVTYNDMALLGEKYGFLVSYDGMEVCV